jgi:hypothetical protein
VQTQQTLRRVKAAEGLLLSGLRSTNAPSSLDLGQSGYARRARRFDVMKISATQASTPASFAAADELESIITRCASRGRDAAPELTPALSGYWLALPRRTEAERRGLLETVRARVRRGELAPRALVLFALGDHCVDIVATAAADYLAPCAVSIERRAALVDEALDWIRRRLALNRAAVFAALLALADADIDDRLRALRLQLDAAERDIVKRRADTGSVPGARLFVAEWEDLLA